MVPLIPIVAAMIAVGPGVTVTGRVLDQEGQPIAGARVSWAIDWRYQEGRETTTNADGQFTLERVTDDPIVLTVQAAGHAPELKKIPPGAARKPIEFRLGPGHTIRGRIVDAFGKPIAGMPIEVARWRQSPSLRWQAITDADGRFRWDEAPADAVAIEMNSPIRDAKRTLQTKPDGPELTIRMDRPLRVRGRVTDAETGRPIRPFRLVAGRCSDDHPYIWWEYATEETFAGLSYDLTLGMTTRFRVIRVEAEGYLPAVSRRIKDDEGEAIVHFSLRRGEGTSGIVHRLNGKPMAEAEAMLGTVSRPISIQNGRVDGFTADQWVVQTRRDGRFNLPPQEPPFTILVFDSRGYAIRNVDARPTRPIKLTARPWARIEGTLHFGTRPAPRQTLGIWMRDDPRSWPREVVHWVAFRTTNAEGRFTFDRIPEGGGVITRMIAWGDGTGSRRGSPTVAFKTQAGKTTRLALGTSGRAIVGKAIAPDEVRDFRFIRGELARQPSDPIAPAFDFPVESDGPFRIEAIEPGTYELKITASRRTAGRQATENKTLASIRRKVVVPVIPGGSSDQPIDLGTLRLQAEKKGPRASQTESSR